MSGVAENLRTGCKFSRKRVQLRHDATCQICKTTLIFAEKFRTTGIDFEHETILNIAAHGTRQGHHHDNRISRPARLSHGGRVADSILIAEGIHMQAATSETISVQRVASSLLPMDTLGATIKARVAKGDKATSDADGHYLAAGSCWSRLNDAYRSNSRV